MGLLPEITRARYRLGELRAVGRNDKKTAGFPVSAFFRMTKGRYSRLPRSDLAAFIFHGIEGPHRSDFRRHNRAPEEKPEGISVTTFLRASSTGRTATTRKPSCVRRVSSGPLWLSRRRRRSALRDRPRPRRQIALPDYESIPFGS